MTLTKRENTNSDRYGAALRFTDKQGSVQISIKAQVQIVLVGSEIWLTILVTASGHRVGTKENTYEENPLHFGSISVA